MKLGLVVEGHGEVAAVPILVRRLLTETGHGQAIPDIPPPLRVPKSRLMKEAEFRRAVELMARKTSPDGAILVVLDADSDCPAEVGPRLRAWLSSERPDRRGAVVLACPEFETWFLAAGQSLRNRRGLPDDLAPPRDPQAIRGAKEWLDSRMSNGYRETIDQPALAAVFDWRVTHASSPSFERMARAVSSLIGVRVSPGPERP